MVACSVLLAIGIGVAVIAAGSASSGGTTAEAFAHRLLAEASVPPGARSTTKVRSTWLKFPLDNPAISGLIDLHRFYLVENPPDAVEGYVESHLPKGAKVNETTTSSGPTGTATGVSVSLRSRGPISTLLSWLMTSPLSVPMPLSCASMPRRSGFRTGLLKSERRPQAWLR